MRELESGVGRRCNQNREWCRFGCGLRPRCVSVVHNMKLLLLNEYKLFQFPKLIRSVRSYKVAACTEVMDSNSPANDGRGWTGTAAIFRARSTPKMTEPGLEKQHHLRLSSLL